MDLIKDNKKLNLEIEKLKKYIKELEDKIKQLESKKHPGGRPSKFSPADKELIKMYRIQGKSYRDIAKMFDCSTRTVHKIINEN